MIPFQFNTTDSYILEFGDYYCRFWTELGYIVVTGTTTPYEISTPFSEDDLQNIQYEQIADIMYIAWGGKPKTIELPATNEVKVTFDLAVNGYVVLKAVGDPPIKKYGIDALSNPDSYFKLGNGTDELWNAKIENDIQNTIYTYEVGTNVIEDDNYYYYNLEIPVGIELNITELGLFNKKNQILFYTQGAPLYKGPETNLIIKYKISKQNLA